MTAESSSRPFIRCVAAALLLFCLCAAQATPVRLNLRDADINDLIITISDITGKNFIVDPRVKGRVTLIAAKDMEKDEIYEVFLSILAVHGFAAVPGDKVIKIIPEAGAKQEDIPTLGEPEKRSDDQVVTQVIQVHNVSAAQIVPILRPLIPPQGHLAAYAPTNVLIVSDRAGNVERIANIIRRVDLASTEEVEIVSLRYASATEVVRVLGALEQARNRGEPVPPGGVSRLVADERTNSVLLSGDASDRLRLRTLIAHLDTPLERVGNTQVIYLRYANAKDLVPVLQGVSKQLGEEGTRVQGQAPPGRPRLGDVIDIQADEATNALVVTGPPEALRSLKAVISQLDVRRAQVLVEAVIAEITAEKAAELGVQWVIDGSQDGNIIGFTNFNLSTSLGSVAAGALSAIEGGTIPALPPGLTLAAGDINSSVRFAALISALANDTSSNVLSTPTLVTLDNEEAEIVVAQNRAFVTGNFTTDVAGGGVSNPFQTIERRDVGLILKVKPQINEGNAVKLEISQEVENVIAETPQGPDTRKRSIKTTVLVEDGQILVLGGLIDDQLRESKQKVPGLGDIPVLGNLFRFRRTSKEKSNLMIFLHPVILRNTEMGTLHTNAKYTYMRQQQFAARQKGVDLLPQAQTPLLPSQEQARQQNSLIDLHPGTVFRSSPGTSPARNSFRDIGFSR